MPDHEAPPSDARQRVGTVLRGKYRIDAVLGVGGMATVYAATHRNTKKFAVKVLHAEMSASRDLRARFLREGYVANSVGHPGVVAILDDDVDDGGAAFLVMELLDGSTVESLCGRSGAGLAARDALAITRQLLDVLEAAHGKGIIHRDIKPANVFVLRSGRVKVLDFGIARLRDVSPGVLSTRDGAILGTPAFMAPEQALAQGSEVDARTDVWAAGAMLFTMISGQYVHEGDNGRQMLIRAATVPARSLASVSPATPVAIVDVVARALAFERNSRWESAAAMGDAIVHIERESFGDSVHHDLATLFETGLLDSGGAPTEPGPPAESGFTPAPAPTLLTKVATGADAVATTTAKPVSGRKSEGPSRRFRSLAGFLAVAGVLLASALAALRPGEATLVRRPPPAMLALASAAPPVASPVVSVAGPETLAVNGRAVNVPLAAPGVASASAPRRRPSPGVPSPSPRPSAALPAVPLPAAAPSVPPRDRLRIELQ
jgi:serine/threonine protein kinase